MNGWVGALYAEIKFNKNKSWRIKIDPAFICEDLEFVIKARNVKIINCIEWRRIKFNKGWGLNLSFRCIYKIKMKKKINT